jgi:SAM-dependent methyltransferase
VLTIRIVQTIATALLTWALIEESGIAGAAWALLLPMPLASAAFAHGAARECDVSILDLGREVFDGLPLPNFACGAAILLLGFAYPSGRSAIIAIAAIGGVVYAAFFYVYGARPDERMLVHSALDRLLNMIRPCYPALGALCRALRVHPGGHPFGLAISELIRDPYASPEFFDRLYQSREDPWDYAINPQEVKRHRLAIDLLDRTRSGRLFSNALEIGCAEGIFTEMLSQRCERLLAVDFSQVALERARKRLRGDNVFFRQWDLRKDYIPDHFDLIVAMDVLTTIHRPLGLRAAFSKLIAGMRTADLLLAGDFRENRTVETSWWSRHLLRGGKCVIAALASENNVQQVAAAATDTHVFALLRKI